jgi:hypothetical protein
MPGPSPTPMIPVRPEPGMVPVIAAIMTIEPVRPGRIPDGKVVRIEVWAVVVPVFPPGVDAVGLKGAVVLRFVVDCMDRIARNEIFTFGGRLYHLVTWTRAGRQKKRCNNSCQMSHLRVQRIMPALNGH